MAASAVAASIAVPTTIAATLAIAAGTLDVLLPALGANAAARTRSIALFKAVRTLLVTVPKATLSITVAATASVIAVEVAALTALETVAVAMRTAAGTLIHADAQLTARHVSLGDTGQLLAGQVRGDIDQREGRVDFDVADIAAVNAALACDRADDRTGLHAVLLAHLDAVAGTGAGCRVPGGRRRDDGHRLHRP